MKLIHLTTGKEFQDLSSAYRRLKSHPTIYVRAELPEHWRVEMYDKSLEWARAFSDDDFSDDLDWVTNYDLSDSGYKVDGFCSMKEGMQLPQISRAEFEHHIYNPWKEGKYAGTFGNENRIEDEPNPYIETSLSRASHYNQQPIEVIDMMLSVYGKEAVKHFCLLNSFKYRMRAGHKDDALQDIEKAKWYEAKAKEIDGTPTT